MSGRAPGVGSATAVAVAAIAVDQASKALVRGHVDPGRPVELIGGLQIVRVTNRGIAFGLLDDAGSAVLVIAAVAFAILLGLFLAGAERRGLWLPVGLLAGGAIGNLIDRIRAGFVTDFIDPPAWPAFNLADIEITVGVFLLVGIYLLAGDAPTPPERAGPPERT